MAVSVKPPLLLDPEGVAAPLLQAQHGGRSSRGVVLDIHDDDLVPKVNARAAGVPKMHAHAVEAVLAFGWLGAADPLLGHPLLCVHPLPLCAPPSFVCTPFLCVHPLAPLKCAVPPSNPPLTRLAELPWCAWTWEPSSTTFHFSGCLPGRAARGTTHSFARRVLSGGPPLFPALLMAEAGQLGR